MSKGKMKNGKIEFLRFSMAVIVALFHSHTFAPAYSASILPRGLLAVELFFILSGYLMMSGCMKRKDQIPANIGKDTQKFIWKKICALGPDYWVASVVAILMCIPIYNVKTIKGLTKLVTRSLSELTFTGMAGFQNMIFNGVDWYISVMLVSMVVMYPLARRFPEHFARIIAPVLTLFILGAVFRVCGNLNVTTAGNNIGVFYPGLFRGAGEIALGCALWPAVEAIKNAKLTRAGHIAAGAAELFCYAGVLLIMHTALNGNYDYAALLLSAVGICFSFGHRGAIAPVFDNRLVAFLSRLGFDIYLCNSNLRKWYARWPVADTYEKNLLLYMAQVFVIALCIRLVSALISKIWPWLTGKVRQLLFASGSV